MKSIGTYEIYLTGSRKYTKRAVTTDGTKYFIKWYGNMVEVKRGYAGYFMTVEKY